jgi:hypothetical protein
MLRCLISYARHCTDLTDFTHNPSEDSVHILLICGSGDCVLFTEHSELIGEIYILA